MEYFALIVVLCVIVPVVVWVKYTNDSEHAHIRSGINTVLDKLKFLLLLLLAPPGWLLLIILGNFVFFLVK